MMKTARAEMLRWWYAPTASILAGLLIAAPSENTTGYKHILQPTIFRWPLRPSPSNNHAWSSIYALNQRQYLLKKTVMLRYTSDRSETSQMVLTVHSPLDRAVSLLLVTVQQNYLYTFLIQAPFVPQRQPQHQARGVRCLGCLVAEPGHST